MATCSAAAIQRSNVPRGPNVFLSFKPAYAVSAPVGAGTPGQLFSEKCVPQLLPQPAVSTAPIAPRNQLGSGS